MIEIGNDDGDHRVVCTDRADQRARCMTRVKMQTRYKPDTNKIQLRYKHDTNKTQARCNQIQTRYKDDTPKIQLRYKPFCKQDTNKISYTSTLQTRYKQDII